jgi:TolB protein
LIRGAVRVPACVWAGLLLSLAIVPAPTAAQQVDTLPGVELSLLYEGQTRPRLGMARFQTVPGAESLAAQVEAIVRRDLDLSDRFQIVGSLPPALVAREELDYPLWVRAGVTYLVRGRVERAEGGFSLYVEIHDVVYGRLLAVRHSELPPETHRDFRMAVHVASDAVVEEIFDAPGIAATRIAFAMRAAGTQTKDLWVVDSDGENLRRVSRHDLALLSPSWHPDGSRVLFLSLGLDGDAGIYELDLDGGIERRLPSLGPGQPNSPTYLPDGDRVAITLDRGYGSRIVSYDLARGCCVSPLVEGGAQNLSPAFSPDRRWVAFTSNRTGRPLVFVQPIEVGEEAAGGGTVPGGRPAPGEARLIAPYVAGEPADFSSPEWSPLGGAIAYHGSLGRGKRYQIVVTEFGDGPGRTLQLTNQGNNESPSWAPDGHHLVFVGERAEGSGLFVIDTATGRTRRLVSSAQISTPAWSPRIAVDASRR